MGKKIAAIIGIVVLALMYILTLVLALIGTPQAVSMLKASILATIIIPVFLYIWMIMIKVLKNKKPIEDDNLIKFDNKASINLSNDDIQDYDLSNDDLTHSDLSNDEKK